MSSGWFRSHVYSVRAVIGTLVVAGVLLFIVQGANRPADPVLGAPVPAPVSGFGQISFRIGPEGAPGSAPWRCALLADSEEQRTRGLMNVTHLSGHDGMIFRFEQPTDVSFHMKDTIIPLSIAWFDETGRFVSSADMEPCGEQPACPEYTATGQYRFALEVPKGALDDLGIAPGSRLEVRDGCG